MKHTLIAFVKYYLFWFAYCLFIKIFFLIFNLSASSTLSISDFFGLFLHGSLMDLSVAGYFSMLPGVLLAFNAFISPKLIAKMISIYTLVILIAVSFLGLMDMALYEPWGTRLNAQVIPAFKNIGGMWASLSWWQWLLTFIVESLVVVLFFHLYKRYISPRVKTPIAYRILILPVMLFFSAALIIPIRGGFDRSPLNHSSVYFSEHLYANHAAYNYFWTFMYAILHNDEQKNPVNYMDEESCEKALSVLNQQNDKDYPQYIHSKNGKPINVVYVILESFSNKVIEPLGGLPDVCPNLNKFSKEGITFSNLIATGARSDKGLSAIMCAYPSLMRASSIVNFPEKLKTMDFFPQYFNEKAYNMSFYYGGDVNFYNTRMLLILSGIKDFITKSDFPISQHTQKWGVPDEHLYKRMYDDLTKADQPFFSMVYNISSHAPFDVPENYQKFKGMMRGDKYCNSVAYADSCLGVFINDLKKTDFWDNSLVVITPDHASLEPGPTSYVDLSTFKVPLILMGGAVDTAFVVDRYVQQTDIAPTIVQQMGWEVNPSYFSRNLFGDENYAFFNNADGWGYVSPEIGFYIDIETEKQTYYYGQDFAKKDSVEHFAKAYVQYLQNDFVKR